MGDLTGVEYIVMTRLRIHWRLDNHTEKYTHPETLKWPFVEADGDYSQPNALIDRFTSATVGGIHLADLLKAHNVGLVQFAPAHIWPSFYVASQLTELLQNLFDEQTCDGVVVYTGETPYERIFVELVKSFAKAYGFEVQIHRATEGLSLQKLKTNLKRWLKGLGVAYLVRLIRRTQRVWSAQHKRSRHAAAAQSPDSPIMFVTFGERYWNADGSGAMHDMQCYPIAKALQEIGLNNFSFIDTQSVSIPELEMRSDTIANAHTRWWSFDSFGTKMFWNFAFNWRQRNRLRRRTINDPEFHTQLSHCGISLVPALDAVFRDVFLDIAFEAEEFLLTARQILMVLQPRAVVLTYETGPMQRALIIEAERANIPTIGLQHGMIFKNHYDYVYACVSTDPFRDTLAVAVPKQTCVWGSLWADSLTCTGSYSISSVQITGNWRYDKLMEQKENASREILPIIHAQQSGKPVAIMTAANDIESYVRHCFEIIAEHDGLFPIVKLHPVDSPEKILSLIADFNLPPETLYTGDLLPLLVQSKFVISQFSTVVSEAILLDKDVILSNLTGLKFSSDYQDSRACLYAETVADLHNHLESLENNSEVRKDLAKARNVFIEKTCFRLDGRSALRVAEVICSEAVM